MIKIDLWGELYVSVNYQNKDEGLKKLGSVVFHAYCDFEHIIIDVESTDRSVDVIKAYVALPAGKNISYWISISRMFWGRIIPKL